MTFAYIGLGGNSIGARRHLQRAVRLLKKLPAARLTDISPLYASAPIGCPGRQREYCNCVIKLQTVQSPRRIFGKINQIERHIQRRRRRRNAPRRLDADYLMHGDAVLRDARLILPHPRMSARAFVLLPLGDIVGADYAGQKHAQTLKTARDNCAAQSLRRL